MSDLAAAGFATYDDYLRSGQWRDKRNRVVAKQGGLCPCGVPISDVHHRTYKRIGNERMDDLVGLCRPCHLRIHKLCDDGHQLWSATKRVLNEARRTPGAVKPKKKRRKHKTPSARSKAQQKAKQRLQAIDRELVRSTQPERRMPLG